MKAKKNEHTKSVTYESQSDRWTKRQKNEPEKVDCVRNAFLVLESNESEISKRILAEIHAHHRTRLVRINTLSGLGVKDEEGILKVIITIKYSFENDIFEIIISFRKMQAKLLTNMKINFWWFMCDWENRTKVTF